jgi:hypothetical protein
MSNMQNKLFHFANQPAWTAYDCNLLRSFHVKPPARPQEEITRPPLFVGLTVFMTGIGFLAVCVAHLIVNF